MNNPSKFGIGKNEEILQRYKGRFVEINPLSSKENYFGKLKEISNGEGVLNPYLYLDYTSGEPIRKIKKDNKGIYVPNLIGSIIKPFPRKNLEALCAYWNAQDKEVKKEKEKTKELRDKITNQQTK